MATYNGAQYLREQLDSILPQLTDKDELIISDDNSSDGTRDIIAGYGLKVLLNPGKRGHVQNFAHAIAHATGDFIALSDQDDIWTAGRLELMVERLRQLPSCSLLVSDYSPFRGDREPIASAPLGPLPSSRPKTLALLFLGKMKYFACTYMFTKELAERFLPIPAYIEAHDLWIAMNACLRGKIEHLEAVTTLRRLHDANLTPPHRRGLGQIAKSRIGYAFGLVAHRNNIQRSTRS